MSSPIEKLLKALRKVHVSIPDVLAQELNTDKGRIEAILGALLSQGRIRIVGKQGFCSSCPFSKICSSGYKDHRSKKQKDFRIKGAT